MYDRLGILIIHVSNLVWNINYLSDIHKVFFSKKFSNGEVLWKILIVIIWQFNLGVNLFLNSSNISGVARGDGGKIPHPRNGKNVVYYKFKMFKLSNLPAKPCAFGPKRREFWKFSRKFRDFLIKISMENWLFSQFFTKYFLDFWLRSESIDLWKITPDF